MTSSPLLLNVTPRHRLSKYLSGHQQLAEKLLENLYVDDAYQEQKQSNKEKNFMKKLNRICHKLMIVNCKTYLILRKIAKLKY